MVTGLTFYLLYRFKPSIRFDFRNRVKCIKKSDAGTIVGSQLSTAIEMKVRYATV